MEKLFLLGEVLIFSLFAFVTMHKKIAAFIFLILAISLFLAIEFILK
jgi:hypothetical protein